jgi:hypothetical protein
MCEGQVVDGVLVFGDRSGDRLEIGPFERFPDDLQPVASGFTAPMALWCGGDTIARRTGEIEPLALSNLRSDLLELRWNGHGSVTFSDHDMTLVRLDGRPGGPILMEITLANADVWDEPIGAADQAMIDDVIFAIDAVARAHGPLTGDLGCCGRPVPTYRPLPLD